MTEIKAVCFDVGEVLIRLDPSRLIAALNAKTEGTVGDTLHRLGEWAPYDQLERGMLGEAAFLAEAKKQWGASLKGSDFETTFRSVWNSVLVAEIDGVGELMKKLKGRGIKLYGLSNSNPLHIAHCLKSFPCLGALDHLFTSYELRARKPEQKAFDIMLHRIKMAPDSVLFFDDRFENIEAARKVGMRAEWIQSSPADVEKFLKAHGLV